MIQIAVNKFQSFFNQIEERNHSGVTEQDRICQALEMYKSIQKTAFSFIHCWNELRHSNKFSSTGTKKKSKNSKTGSLALTASTPADTINLDENDVDNEHSFDRPIGKKAAKEFEKKSKGKNCSVQSETIQILAEIRDSQKQQSDDRKEMAAEFLKIEKEREEREKRKEEREQMICEQNS